MSGAAPGYWRRLVRHLTTDASELDAEDLPAEPTSPARGAPATAAAVRP